MVQKTTKREVRNMVKWMQGSLGPQDCRNNTVLGCLEYPYPKEEGQLDPEFFDF